MRRIQGAARTAAAHFGSATRWYVRVDPSVPRLGARPLDLRSPLVTDIPDDLIKLECAAETARAKMAGLTGDEYDAQWRAWREASTAFHAAVTEYAGRDGVTMSRYEVEQAAKKAVRHAQEDPAVE